MLTFTNKMFDEDSNKKDTGGQKKPPGNGFSKIPTFTLLAGSAIVVGSGLYLLWHETGKKPVAAVE